MAIDFTTNQQISIGNTAGVNQYTISVWVYLDTDTTATIFDRGNNLLFRAEPGRIVGFQHRQSDSTLKFFSTTGTLTLNTWTHLFAIADGTNMNVYFDNVVDATSQTYDGTSIAAATDTDIGANNTPAEGWEGYLADIRMYSRAFNASERKLVYESRGSDNLTADLIFRYPMTEKPTGTTATGTALDLSNGSLTGTFVNSPTFIEAPFNVRKP